MQGNDINKRKKSAGYDFIGAQFHEKFSGKWL